MPLIHGVAQLVAGDVQLLIAPVLVIGAAEKDPDAEIDLHQIVGHQLSVDDDPRGDEHLAAPLGHVAILEVADLWILECAPAAEQDTALPYLLVARERLVEEVE